MIAMKVFNNHNTAIITSIPLGWMYNDVLFSEPWSAAEQAKLDGHTHFIVLGYSAFGKLEMDEPEAIDAYLERIANEYD